MTLDEAISYSMGKYRECMGTNPKCSLEHYQIATWLSELKLANDEKSRYKRLLKIYSCMIPILVGVQSSVIVLLIIKVLKLKGLI